MKIIDNSFLGAEYELFTKLLRQFWQICN